MKPIFVKTKNVKGFINLIYNLKNKPDNISKIGLVYGNAGLGKTKTAIYLSIQFDTIYVRATNKMTTKWLLEEIAKELDEIPRFYTADIFRQCVNALKTNLKMIIVDEIDYLLADFRTIEILRDLHDETGVPIILVGMQLSKHKLKNIIIYLTEFLRFITSPSLSIQILNKLQRKFQRLILQKKPPILFIIKQKVLERLQR